MFNCTKCFGLFISTLPTAQPNSGGKYQAICADGSPHSFDANVSYLPNGSSGSGQSNWWACNLCATLFYAGNNVGVCPVHHHDHTDSGDYTLNMKQGAQGNWWWCSNCYNLFFSPDDIDTGFCAKTNGPHARDPENQYFLNPSGGQPGWFHYSNCQCLYFGQTNKAGRMPEGWCAY